MPNEPNQPTDMPDLPAIDSPASTTQNNPPIADAAPVPDHRLSWVERSGEQVARFINRRNFLRTAAVAAFAFAAAGAAELKFVPSAEAANACQANNVGNACSPPGGTYCTSWSTSYCSGATCSGGCSYNYTWYKSTACWCTTPFCDSLGTHYWKCCDCTCLHNGSWQACGCRELDTISRLC